MNSKEQKLLIDNLLSSGEVYSRCAGIIDSEYFDPEYRNVIKYIAEYSEKYGATPSFDLVNAKFDHNYKERTLTKADRASTCVDLELFCQQKALTIAIMASLDDIENGNNAAVQERIKKASMVSLEKDMGVEMFENPEEYLLGLLDTDYYYSTGILALDKELDGGLARKQLTLFSANSGVGKSVMLSNLGANFAQFHGLNVVYISLELAEPMIYKRNAFIMTGTNTAEWKEKISFMATRLKSIKTDGSGSYLVKRLPTGSCINDVRSFLKQYELEYGVGPDVIIIDYLDLLSPNEGTKNLSISEQDKFKSEQYSQLLHDYNAIGVSASQQNREAIKMAAPDQSVIAGGMTKVNTVDNFISLFMDAAHRNRGEMLAFFLKTRSSSGVGRQTVLKFDASCLRIGDPDGAGRASLVVRMKDKKKRKGLDELDVQTLDEKINLPGLAPATTPTASKLDQTLDKLENGVTVTKPAGKRDNIADVGNLLADKKPRGKKVSAMDILDEEERITQYGKGEVNPELIKDKTLPAETEEFLQKHAVGTSAREYLLGFME